MLLFSLVMLPLPNTILRLGRNLWPDSISPVKSTLYNPGWWHLIKKCSSTKRSISTSQILKESGSLVNRPLYIRILKVNFSFLHLANLDDTSDTLRRVLSRSFATIVKLIGTLLSYDMHKNRVMSRIRLWQTSIETGTNGHHSTSNLFRPQNRILRIQLFKFCETRLYYHSFFTKVGCPINLIIAVNQQLRTLLYVSKSSSRLVKFKYEK